MGFSHQYDLVREVDEDKDDLRGTKNEPRYISPPVVTAWWKLMLCNLIAAAVGAGIMFSLTQGYSKLQNSSGDASASTSAISSTTPVLATSTNSATALTISTATAELAKAIKATDNDPDGLGTQILDCGGNPAEAREKGCVYDVMMQDWVPEPCYDKVLTEKYLAEGNWTWYADGEGKTTLSDDEMAKGEHGRAWMSVSYHKAHCVFSWMKIIRALRNNRGISQELLSYDHVMHCSMGALKQDSEDEGLGVSAPTNYAKCALYDTWLQNPIPDQHDSTSR